MGRWSISDLEDTINWALLFIILAFFFMIPLKYLIPSFIPSLSPLFEQIFETSSEGSNYGFAAAVFLSCFGFASFAIAGYKKWEFFSRREFFIKIIKENYFASANSIEDATIGATIGTIAGIFVLFFNHMLIEVCLTLPQIIESIEIYQRSFFTILNSLIIGPILEEFAFRGSAIPGITRIIKGKSGILMALFISTMIFAWSHPRFPELKILGGLFFGTLYLWKKNLYAPIFAHAFCNLTIILFTG
ncbi:MAG: CPBP family intramembrane metalloprotease [Candidatus Methanomethylicia archaeon]|nr:CPBP family intramembrane metalloprotease [Candidatus Methanomethylicia archaeon]